MTSAPRDGGGRVRWPSRPVLAAFLLVLAFGAAVVVGSFVESHRQHLRTEEVLRNQGQALVEALGHAIEDTMLANREIDDLTAGRLLGDARLLSMLESADRLDSVTLDDLALDLELTAVLLLDRNLRVVRSVPDGLGRETIEPYLASLTGFVDGPADSLLLAPRQEPGTRGRRLAAAVRRPGGGLLLTEADSRQVLLFDDALGIAHLLETVADTGGILEATMLGPDGRVLAGARGLSDDDEPEPTLVERPILLEPGRIGTLRIGLSARAVEEAHRAGLRRAWLIAAVMLGLSFAVASAVAAAARARSLRGESARTRAETDAVLEGLVDAVIVLDDDERVRLVNPAAERLCERDRDALLGRDARESSCAVLAEAAGVPVSTVTEVRVPRPDGEPIPLLVSASAVLDENGRERGRAIVLRDLTRLKELEAQTRRAESLSALGRLAGTVAHEVRNPLNAIAVGIQRLQREFVPGERRDEYGRLTGIVRNEVGRLDEIVNRFLDFARAPRLNPTDGDLDRVIEEVVALQAQGLPPGVTLELEATDAPRARFDVTATRQVLLNVIRNAVEAVGERGRIRVSSRSEPEHAVIEVQDDGPGLPDDGGDRLFEFGFTTKADGTGMGLAVVQRLVVEMGGTVELSGTGETEGTLVRIRLPRPAAPSREEER